MYNAVASPAAHLPAQSTPLWSPLALPRPAEQGCTSLARLAPFPLWPFSGRLNNNATQLPTPLPRSSPLALRRPAERGERVGPGDPCGCSQRRLCGALHREFSTHSHPTPHPRPISPHTQSHMHAAHPTTSHQLHLTRVSPLLLATKQARAASICTCCSAPAVPPGSIWTVAGPRLCFSRPQPLQRQRHNI